MSELLDMAEKEFMSIQALCDLLIAVDAALLARNTVASIGELLSECGARLYECVKEIERLALKKG